MPEPINKRSLSEIAAEIDRRIKDTDLMRPDRTLLDADYSDTRGALLHFLYRVESRMVGS